MNMHKFGKCIKNQAPTILTVIGIFGVVGTAVTTAQATIKAEELIRERTDANSGVFPTLTTEEKIRASWPAYIPPVIVGLSTIACFVSANVLNRRQQAALAGAYIFLDQTYRNYKNKVVELYGKEADRTVRESTTKDAYEPMEKPADNETLIFYEEHQGEFFQRTMLEVMDAEYRLNRKFALEGEASINDFFEFLSLNLVEGGDLLGWSQEASFDFYNYAWIDFEHELVTMDDGMECYIINMPKAPTSLLPF